MCNNYRKLNISRIFYIFNGTLVLSIICDKWGGNDDGIFQEEESIKILKFICLINNVNY